MSVTSNNVSPAFTIHLSNSLILSCHQQPLVRQGKPAGMDRGLLIAHKETWDQFIRQRESNPHRMMFNETDDVLVVFEGWYWSLSAFLHSLLASHPLTNPANSNPGSLLH